MPILIGSRGTNDHDELNGLDQDDHEQYLKNSVQGNDRMVIYFGPAVPANATQGSLWLETPE